MTQKVVPASGTIPAVTTTWKYRLNNTLDTLSDTNLNMLVDGYDTAGRLTSAATTIPGITGALTSSYQLDQAGNRARLTWPDGYYVAYGYDAMNRMVSASESGTTSLATYSYDAFSQRTNVAFPHGTNTAYTYALGGDLLTLNHTITGTGSVPDYTLGYNAAHQLTGETSSDSTYVWQPTADATDAYAAVNVLNQYPSWTPSGGASHTFSYDALGNMTAAHIGGTTWAYTYDNENRMITACKPSPCSSPTVSATYAYDAQGRRTHKSGTGVTETFFLDDGQDEIAEYDGTGTLTNRYVPGPAINDPVAQVPASGVRHFFLRDHHGSVIAVIGYGGTQTEGPYTYDPYGNCFEGASPCAGTSATPYRFTGMRLDLETGLYYDRARYYSPLFGRFNQTDPVGYTADLNLYTYVGNDPTDKVDPSGKVIKCTGSGKDMVCAVTADNATDKAKNVPVTKRNPKDESYGLSVIPNLKSPTSENSATITHDANGNPQQTISSSDKGFEADAQAGKGVVSQHDHPEKGGSISPGYHTKSRNDGSVLQKGGISQIYNNGRTGTLTVGSGGVTTYETTGNVSQDELHQTQYNVNQIQSAIEDAFSPKTGN